MNCIIIDDDKISRILFENYINKIDFLELHDSFETPIKAINILESNKEIDLIFLDIEMPEMTGVEFIKNLKNLPQIIIISAREKYALDAIEYGVTDYLLKPVAYARFYKAVKKAYEKHQNINKLDKNEDGIFIKSSSSSLVRIKYDEILWVEALENYVLINTLNNKYTIHFTMKAIINKLPHNMFARVHRSYIVNIFEIKMIEDNMVVIEIANEKKRIPIAKSYKESLMKSINIMTK